MAVALEALFDGAIAPRTSAVAACELAFALRISSDMEAVGRPHRRDRSAHGPLLRTTLRNASKASVPSPCPMGVRI